MDLMRAVIIGASGTPYQDGLFFFDFYLPPEFPQAPPVITTIELFLLPQLLSVYFLSEPMELDVLLILPSTFQSLTSVTKSAVGVLSFWRLACKSKPLCGWEGLFKPLKYLDWQRE